MHSNLWRTFCKTFVNVNNSRWKKQWVVLHWRQAYQKKFEHEVCYLWSFFAWFTNLSKFITQEAIKIIKIIVLMFTCYKMDAENCLMIWFDLPSDSQSGNGWAHMDWALLFVQKLSAHLQGIYSFSTCKARIMSSDVIYPTWANTEWEYQKVKYLDSSLWVFRTREFWNLYNFT